MGQTLKSHAEPVMLSWCRRSARRTTAEAAKAARVPEAKIAAWEGGDGTPSMHQLKKLATLYKRPTCVFYLKSPPQDFTIMRDFRSVPAPKRGEFSPELALAIREAKERSLWLSDLMKSSGEPILDFVGSCTTKLSPEQVGKRLRRLIGVTLSEQQQSVDNAAAFRLWRKRCEELGVCVFAVSKVDVAEARGFAIVDNLAPVVAVNSKDAVTAKTFTLLHEMVHLLIGKEGVSNISFSSSQHSRDQKIEVFCNAAAAEALVPALQLTNAISSFGGNNTLATVSLAKQFHVSEEVIARRLLDLGQLSTLVYRRIRAAAIARAALAEKNRKDRPKREIKIPQFQKTKSRIGGYFAKAAIGAFYNEDIDGFELSQLLGMKLDHLPRLEASLFPFRVGFRSHPTS